MRSLSFVLNFVLVIVCGALFLKNQGLKSDLSVAKSAVEKIQTSGVFAKKKRRPEALRAIRAEDQDFEQLVPEDLQMNYSDDERSEELGEQVEERIQDLLEERIEEEVQREMERHHQERMAHRQKRMEQDQTRMTEALYDHLEAVEWDADVAEQVEALILDDIELHRDLHEQVTSGELEHFEARAQIHEQKRAQREELGELIGAEQTHDLLVYLRDARHEGRGGP